MAENKSPNLHIDGLSPGHNILSKDQGRSEELPFGMLGSTTDEDYASLTPEQKLGSQELDTPAYTSKTYLSSISGNSDISVKEGSEAVSSSSSSSSDAESGTYDWPAKNYMIGDDVLQPKAIDLEFDSNEIDENLNIAEQEGWEAIRKEDGNTEELLRKIANYEAELKLTKNKLHSSEEEIARVKLENLTLLEELGYTTAKLRNSEDSMEKMEKNFKIELEKQQKQFEDQLNLANQSIEQSQAELGSERRVISELQETISKMTKDQNDYTSELEELKLMLHGAQEDYSNEITCLHKERDELKLRTNVLEEQIKQYEAEEIVARRREMGLVDEIEQLSQSIDQQNLMYDMLMAEKDDMFARMQTLTAELNHRNTSIVQLEERIIQLTTAQKELLDESEKVQKVVQALRSKLSDQEQEMQKQRDMLYDRAEEKREAIRQLCFSLEYYRIGYHELREAFVKHKHPAVLAA